MAIRTFTRSPAPFRAVIHEGTPQSVAEIVAFADGQVAEVIAGVVALRIGEDIVYVRPGWGVYVEDGTVGAVSPDVAATWRPVST